MGLKMLTGTYYKMKLLLVICACVCLISAEASIAKPVTSRQHKGNDRIIGGDVADSGQFPFAAAIYIDTPDGRFLCTGSIIDERHILTAGHCSTGATRFVINLGSNKISEPDVHRITVTARTFFVHPEFDPTTLSNDVCLIRLDNPLEFNDYIKPVTFLPATDIGNDVTVTALGWGITRDDDVSYPDNLYFVDVKTITNTQCASIYGVFLHDYNVCTTGLTNQGSCAGDSGGPLVLILPRGDFLQVGINSFYSSRGCEYGDPSGYTRLFTYMDWVEETIKS